MYKKKKKAQSACICRWDVIPEVKVMTAKGAQTAGAAELVCRLFCSALKLIMKSYVHALFFWQFIAEWDDVFF